MVAEVFQLLSNALGRFVGFVVRGAAGKFVEWYIITPLLNAISGSVQAYARNTLRLKRPYVNGEEMSLATSTLPGTSPYAELNLTNFSPHSADSHIQLLLLSSLVYESKPIIDDVLSGFDKEFLDKGNNQALVIFLPTVTETPTILLVWRGTEVLNFVDWLTDAKWLQVASTELVVDGQVHGGFYEGIYIRPNKMQQVLDAIHNFSEKHHVQKVNLIITGHSLGAGLAVLSSAFKMLVDDSVVDLKEVCAFAGPVVGNKTFTDGLMDKYDEKRIKFTHYVLRNDIVPRVHRYPKFWTSLVGSEYEEFRKSCVLVEGRERVVFNGKIPDLPEAQVGSEIASSALKLATIIPSEFANQGGNPINIDTPEEFRSFCKHLLPFWLIDHFPSEYLQALKEFRGILPQPPVSRLSQIGNSISPWAR